MAKKKSSVNKSEEIRKYLGTHPADGPTAIQAALAKGGVDVSTALVSKVKADLDGGGTSTKKRKTKKKAKRKVKRSKAAVRAAAANGRADLENPIEDLKQAGNLMMEAVELVMKAGAAEAKQLVNMAADVVKKVRD